MARREVIYGDETACCPGLRPCPGVPGDGDVPLALMFFLIGIPFGWETAAFAGIAGLGFGAGISALGIPIVGLVISWAWPERFGS